MIADAADAPARGHRRGRPARRRRRRRHRRRASTALRHRLPPSRCWASRSTYIPHGKPDAILADLGLDADGIAATVRAAARRLTRVTGTSTGARVTRA